MLNRKDLLGLIDASEAEITEILDLAHSFKERIKKGEIVDALDPEIFAEVTECPEYPMAVEFRDKMLTFCPVAFPESEAQFIAMHICNMLAE